MTTTTQAIPQTELTADVPASWGADLRPAGCPVCKQAFLVPSQQLPGVVCPQCFKASLVEQNVWLRKEPAELIVPFAVQPAALEGLLAEFTHGVWLHTDDFNAREMAGRARLIFWPEWLVDTDVSAAWNAEAGYGYQVKSSQESYGGGGWSTQERVENRLRWEPRAGTLKRHYDNVAAPAVSDRPQLKALIGEYQRQKAVPYSAVHTASVRVPDVQPESAWPSAQTALQQTAVADCRTAAGADQMRGFVYDPRYESLNWTQMLLPLYATYYTDDEGNPRRVLINGQTGAVGGLRLASRSKGLRVATILAGVGLLLLLLGGLGAALSAMLPPLAVLGAVMIGVGLLVCASAIVPAIWPWQWNRGQTTQT